MGGKVLHLIRQRVKDIIPGTQSFKLKGPLLTHEGCRPIRAEALVLWLT